MPSLSDNSSARFLVPSTFLRVVCASSRVEEWAFDTLATAEMGQNILKYTTPSTDTVTESLVRICSGNVSYYHVFTAVITQVDVGTGSFWIHVITKVTIDIHQMIWRFLRERKMTFSSFKCVMKTEMQKTLPLGEECQRIRFSNPLSQRYQCRVKQRKVLQRRGERACIYCDHLSQKSHCGIQSINPRIGSKIHQYPIGMYSIIFWNQTWTVH